MRILALFGALALLPTGVPRASEPSAQGKVYDFGVVPLFEQRRLYSVWSPIVSELSRRTGLRFRLITTLAIDDFTEEFERERFDFAYINPYHVLRAAHYLPLVADGAPLRGILVVRRDSTVRGLEELDGKEVAFPSPNALGAALLMRADLERLHHVKVKPLYVKTHSSVYLHVAQGLTAAGGGVEKTLREQPPELRALLRVLYTTRGLPSHPVAAHRRVSAAVRAKVQAALLAMDATPQGRKLLAEIPAAKLIPAAAADYDEMRTWGLDAYWVNRGSEDGGR